MNDNPLFLGLIMSLSTSAMAQMGKMPNPMTGKVEKDMAGARQTIDLVHMLSEKTKNNLTQKEEKLLKDTLTSLQLTFVNEQKSDSGSEAKKDETAPVSENTPPSEESKKSENAEKEAAKESEKPPAEKEDSKQDENKG